MSSSAAASMVAMPRYLLRQKPPAQGGWVRSDVDYDSGGEVLDEGSVVTLDDSFDWKVTDFEPNPPEPYDGVALISRT